LVHVIIHITAGNIFDGLITESTKKIVLLFAKPKLQEPLFHGLTCAPIQYIKKLPRQ